MQTLTPAPTHPTTDAGPTAPLVALIGPSAAGKSSVVRELDRRGVVRVHPTWTTRARRADEGDGSVEHRFVDDATFDELRAGGFFWQTVEMFGLPYRYGLPPVTRSTDGRADLVMLRAPLVAGFRRYASDAVVYQVEAGPGRADRWLRDRGCTAEDLAARTADNVEEARSGRALAHRRFRNEGTVAELADRIERALVRDGAPR